MSRTEDNEWMITFRYFNKTGPRIRTRYIILITINNRWIMEYMCVKDTNTYIVNQLLVTHFSSIFSPAQQFPNPK